MIHDAETTSARFIYLSRRLERELQWSLHAFVAMCFLLMAMFENMGALQQYEVTRFALSTPAAYSDVPLAALCTISVASYREIMAAGVLKLEWYKVNNIPTTD